MARLGRSRKSGKVERKPDGQVRQSQLVGAYGAGALIDLVQHAVVVCGLDDWSSPHHESFIEQPRLKDRLLQRYKIELDDVGYFRRPPAGDDREPSPVQGIRALEFPAWFLCQGCRRLLHRRDMGDAARKDGKRYHECERGKQVKRGVAVPIRFVGACPRGHLQDFPWVDLAHYGKDGGKGGGKDGDNERCKAPELTFDEGRHGEFNDIRVTCVCGQFGRLADTLGEHFKLTCAGRRPWLPRHAGIEECEEKLRLLVRTASNGYFPIVTSALSVPDADNVLRDALSGGAERFRKRLEKFAERGVEKVREELELEYEDLVTAHGIEALLPHALALAKGEKVERAAIRTGEYLQLTRAEPAKTGEHFAEEEEFVHRRIATPEALKAQISSVVLVHRLTEVRVQFGFSRLEPLTADNQGEYDEEAFQVRRAPLSAGARWLPAATVQGEGLFIELNADALAAWEKRPAVQARAKVLEEGWKSQEKARRSGNSGGQPPPFLGARFYLLHSLSHLLINAIAISCGYAASSIRERLYCGPYDKDPTEMAGIMLYTGTAGSEGTLGGLVEQGAELEMHFKRALDGALLCSNDPVCAAHSPAGDPAERWLEGSACHGCLFVSEPSCERFNRYLDRALVVPTIGQDPNCAFFDPNFNLSIIPSDAG